MGSTASITLTLFALALLLGLALSGLAAVLLTAVAALTGGIAGEARTRRDYAADRDAILAAGRAIFGGPGARCVGGAPSGPPRPGEGGGADPPQRRPHPGGARRRPAPARRLVARRPAL